MNIVRQRASEKALANLTEGLPFDQVVSQAFQNDEKEMQTFVREMPFVDLYQHFKTCKTRMNTTPVLGFLTFLQQWNNAASLHRARDLPIAASPQLFKELESFLIVSQSMQENGDKAYAMVIQERIDQDVISALSTVNDRNAMRGLLYRY